jgi:hypothetical protein
MRTVKYVLAAYLRAGGFDGLYSPSGACGCSVDDLAPCSEDMSGCLLGVKVKCDPETCEADGGCDWHIGPREELEI